MLESLLSAGAAILSGGATGLLGTAISAVAGYFQGRAEHKREIELRRLDIEHAKAEADSAERVAATQAEGARDAAEWDAMTASYREAGRRWSRPGDGVLLQLVDFVRGMTRPLLTWALVALVGAIYFLLGAVDVAAADLRPRIVDTVLYLATAAVLWWFGQRQIEKRRAVHGLPWHK